MQSAAQLRRAPATAHSLERQRLVDAVCGSVDAIVSHLETQADQVGAIADDADASAAHARGGADELKRLRTRPSRLRDFAVGVALALAALLAFLHWFSP